MAKSKTETLRKIAQQFDFIELGDLTTLERNIANLLIDSGLLEIRDSLGHDYTEIRYTGP